MKNNIINFHTIQQFFTSYQITTSDSHNLKYASKPIYQQALPTIFFALIQNLFLNSEKQKMDKITLVINNQLGNCNNNQQISKSCELLYKALKEMSLALDQNMEKISQMLKKNLYKPKADFLPFLNWFLSKMTIEKLLETLSNQFNKDFIIYEIVNKKFRKGEKNFQRNKSDQQEVQNQGIMKQIHILFSHENNHILYQYQIYQIDNILNFSNINYKSISKSNLKISQYEKYLKKLQQENNQMQKIIHQKNRQMQTMKNIKNVQIQNLKIQLQYLNKKESQKLQQFAVIKSQNYEFQQLINKQKQQIKQLTKQKFQQSTTIKKDAEQKHKNIKQKLQRQIMKLQKLNQRLNRDNLQLKEQIKILNNQNNLFQLKSQVNPNVNVNIKKNSQKQLIKKPIKKSGNHHYQNFMIKQSSSLCKKQCTICGNVQIPYQIYDCQSHFYCKACHIRYIQSCANQGKIPICPTPQCGKNFVHQTLYNMLKQQKKQQLFEKITLKIYKNQQKDTLFHCPYCNQVYQKPKNLKIVNHCNRNTCTICNEEHTNNQSCNQTNLLKLLPHMERPCICPTCFTLYAKDDQCEHVTCQPCKQRNLQPQGFCPLCSAVRHPILCHDNSYHRPSCKTYTLPGQNQVPKMNNKCPQCIKINGPCHPPAQILTEFLKKNFSPDFINKLLQKRKQYKMDEKN